jgi:hypothetical protein
MFSNVLKLSRRLLILAILSGGLFVTLMTMPSNSAQATGAKCCWQCDELSLVCDELCETNPQQCTPCRNHVIACYATCNPDPGC